MQAGTDLHRSCAESVHQSVVPCALLALVPVCSVHGDLGLLSFLIRSAVAMPRAQRPALPRARRPRQQPREHHQQPLGWAIQGSKRAAASSGGHPKGGKRGGRQRPAGQAMGPIAVGAAQRAKQRPVLRCAAIAISGIADR